MTDTERRALSEDRSAEERLCDVCKDDANYLFTCKWCHRKLCAVCVVKHACYWKEEWRKYD